jgi:hypothetical protein
MKHLNSISFGFVITFVLAGCLAATAQGVGVLTTTGSLIPGCPSHTATLLPNDKVLVAGGQDTNFFTLASAELLQAGKFVEAEPLLLSGYEGLKQREDKIPPNGMVRLKEAIQRLVQLYEATGQMEKAAEMKKELDASK